MAMLLLVSGLALLGLPACTSRWGRRLAPAEWSWLCQTALLTGAVIVEVASSLYGSPTVLRAAGAPQLAAMCERALGLFLPGGAPAGWAAATIAATIPALAMAGGLRARRA